MNSLQNNTSEITESQGKALLNLARQTIAARLGLPVPENEQKQLARDLEQEVFQKDRGTAPASCYCAADRDYKTCLPRNIRVASLGVLPVLLRRSLADVSHQHTENQDEIQPFLMIFRAIYWH